MEKFDVIICGAGISGLYCAQKILEQANTKGEKIRLAILESRPQVGGRIRTTNFTSYPDTAVELGAMRFLENHYLVSSLVKKYKLATHTFSSVNNLYHLRGKAFTNPEAFINQDRYHLEKNESGMTPSQLLAYAIDKVVPRELWDFLDKTKTDEIIESNEYFTYLSNGVSLDTGFKDLLLNLVSAEAFNMIKDGSGYDSSFDNWNSREAINHVINDFLMKSKTYTLSDGFNALPMALESDIKKMGGEFLFNCSLKKISYRNTQNEELIYCEVEQPEKNRCKALKAAKLILAVPQKNLIDITYDSPQFSSKETKELLQLVIPQPAIKVFLTFDNTWWNQLNNKIDLAITDMPLRKVYYSQRAQSSGGVLLAAYADMNDFNFWNGFIDEKQPEECRAPKKMVQTITGMLSKLHNIKIPDPTDSKVIRWSNDHAGAAFHAWKPGIDCVKKMEQILKPIENMPVFICGEAYSRYQCWIEGALYSAECLLNKHFRINS